MTMTDNVTEWRKLRNELDDMLKAREMKYADAVRKYYSKYPKDASEKKSSRKKIISKNVSKEDEFSFDNCVEKKYWKNRPKSENELANDKPADNRIISAIIFFEKLKKFILSQECQKPEQWLVENMGQEILDKLRKEVIAVVKKQIEDEQYQIKKDENGMDEFDF